MDKAKYIVNGRLLSSKNVFSVLSDYNFNEQKIELICLNPEEIGFVNQTRGPLVILSTNVGTQKRKKVRRGLKNARKLFKEPMVKTSHGAIYRKEPAVMLEGKLVDSPTAKALLWKVRLSYFATILVSETAPPSLFGENAQKGLIRIWLKK